MSEAHGLEALETRLRVPDERVSCPPGAAAPRTVTPSLPHLLHTEDKPPRPGGRRGPLPLSGVSGSPHAGPGPHTPSPLKFEAARDW